MKVQFRYRPEPPASGAELRGEMSQWSMPFAMRDAGAGWLEAELALPPGAYEYKYRHAENDWRLDPKNPRTRASGGVENSLLVVGGTDEPVIHVPARPYIFVADDGRVCVRAALRAGAGERLALRWDDGGGVRTEAMAPVGREEQHQLFEAWLPGAGRRLSYQFVLPSGHVRGAPGDGDAPFEVRVSAVRPDTPAWWRRAVVYSIFVDRFRAGGRNGRWRDPSMTDRDARAGGDLAGVIEALPYLSELGVDALHLTPICRAPSVHRYDSSDPRRVDRALGGEPALLALLAATRSRGMRVILDVTVTHVDRDFFAFRDVAEHGPASRYWSWFHIYGHPFSDGPRPGYQHYQKGQWREPLLDTSNNEVADYLVGTFVHWARAGADGFRIDAAADVPIELCERIRRAVRAVNPETVVFGEVVPSHIERWTAGALDAATDFASQASLRAWLAGELAGEAFAASHARGRFRRGPAWSALAFAGTHDQPRIATVLGDTGRSRLAQLWTLCSAATPMIYYGDELGLASDQPDREFEDSWPDRQCMPWDGEGRDLATRALVRQLIALRRARRALSSGDERALDLGHADVVGLRRSAGDDTIDVVLNRGAREVRLELGAVDLLVRCGEARLDGGALVLGPRSGAVLDRRPNADAALVAANRVLALHAFHEGQVETPALPTHLYLTVTEACNLACRHCITDAPARTSGGIAREVPPWVLEALAGGFAAADYIGFTHGGESLVSRALDPVLEAIARARGGRRPPDIHLATNGMLLTPARFGSLVERGVTSLMVSIDGATPATNDHIRAGASLERVLEHVRAALALRATMRADVRIGLSSVVGRRNLGELSALGRLARELGVDWLKIEETYPASAFARADLIGPRDTGVTRAVKELRTELAGTRVVLVDHMSPPAGCRCDSADDPVLRAFRDADDYANRARFAPCRAAWSVACVDPDGTVRAIDYARTPLGNLREHSLAELWNGPVAQRARADALARRTPEQRRRCGDAATRDSGRASER